MDIQDLFSFEGRIRRSQYWLTLLGLLAFVIVAFIVLLAIGGGAAALAGPKSPIAAVMAVFTALLTLGAIALALFIRFAAMAKRWHDRGQSAIFILFSFIPLVNLWAAIELLFLDGVAGPNQYGPSPKGYGEGPPPAAPAPAPPVVAGPAAQAPLSQPPIVS